MWIGPLKIDDYGWLGLDEQIHWFSIFNSFMMVIFLTGLVSMILMRTLRNDYAKYARDEDEELMVSTHMNESFVLLFVTIRLI